VHPETTGFIYFYTPFRIEPMAIGSLPAIVADDELLWTKLVSYRLMLFWAGFALWITTIFLGNNRVTCVFGISGIGAGDADSVAAMPDRNRALCSLCSRLLPEKDCRIADLDNLSGGHRDSLRRPKISVSAETAAE
jgi:hypothetical protein